MQLEVLPNIDINIKQGNSLVSRFDLDSDLGSVFGRSDYSLEDYKEAVRNYKHTGDRTEKHRLQDLIDTIREEYRITLYNNRPVNRKLSRERGRLDMMQDADLFGDKKFTKKEVEKQEKKVARLEEQKSEEESGAFYNQAFEWRFEFPEVLDAEGRFTGFDVVVANPPYIPLEQISEVERDYYRKQFQFVERKFDTSVLFFLQSFDIGKKGSDQMFIAPITWETGENYQKLRKHLFKTISIKKIINLPFDIFEDAYVETGIFHFKVEPKGGGYQIYIFDKKEKVDSLDNLEFTYINKDLIVPPDFKVVFDPLIARIVSRIDEKFIPLGDITISTQGLSGSRYDGKPESKDKLDYPYLEEGQAYNYQLIIDKITYASMDDKKNLKRFYEAEPKLLIRRIVNRRDRLDVGYTEEKLVFKKDINPFVIKDSDFLPRYILGIIASKFISFLYVNTSSIATKDDFRQTTLTELRGLPIPIIEKEKQKEIAVIADQILTAKRNDPDADTSKPEAEIDRLVFELYGLSEEEVGIVEGSVG